MLMSNAKVTLKALRVFDSCETYGQLMVALEYGKLATRRDPLGMVWVHKRAYRTRRRLAEKNGARAMAT